ncbi:TPT-domain-containing protein [Patellaria atrata CBS 101060]|uniref:TPT-domain-containing protein n=1 Tax=Patellaria atrata CBS 101060 TaxID=1346257 RepID=A0A9P4S4G7_9PEZI|nr:TPT-domain-containing protein [Patellaria atrata CBS 101060]
MAPSTANVSPPPFQDLNAIPLSGFDDTASSDTKGGAPRRHIISPRRPGSVVMDDTASNSRRRRSSSLASKGSTGRASSLRPHSKQRAGDIPEEEERKGGDSRRSSISYDESGSEDLELDDMHSDDGLEDDEETGLTSYDRRSRRRRKKRKLRIDERIAGDVKITDEEKKLATKSIVRASLINALLIGLWYLFSISISIYNKWMFSDDDGKNLNFPYPLFTTCMHMVVQFSLASLVLFLFPRFRPRHDSLSNLHSHTTQSRIEPVDPNKPLMTRWFYLTRLGPCGLATGMDIGLGNMSLRFISLTFFTMCKSSVLGFVLLFAFLFRLETPSWRLFAIIATMTVGVVMMVAGEAAFDVRGFALIMCSAASSGFRWSLTQILLLRNPATSNPFSSIFFLAPVMFLSLLLIALPAEGPLAFINALVELGKTQGSRAPSLLLFPGCLAFLMTASEFALLKRTSVVTLSICGIFKEVVTISAASAVFHDPLTPINVSGLVITIAAIAAYNYLKIVKMRDEARLEAHLQHGEVYEAVPEREGEPRPPQESTASLIRETLGLHSSASGPTPGGGVGGQNDAAGSSRASPSKRLQDVE